MQQQLSRFRPLQIILRVDGTGIERFSDLCSPTFNRPAIGLPSYENTDCGLAPQADARASVKYHNIAPGFDMCKPHSGTPESPPAAR